MKTLFLILSIFLTPKDPAVTTFNGEDTVFIFAKTSDSFHRVDCNNSVVWYLLPDTIQPISTTAAKEFLGKHGDGIAVKYNGQWFYRYIIELDTTNYTMDVTADCNATQVKLSQSVTALTYKDKNGNTQTLPRAISFQYNNLDWKDDSGWTEIQQDCTFHHSGSNYILPEIYTATPIMMFTDSAWREELDLPIDTIWGQLEAPVAFAIHPTHTATTRWEGVETNRVNEENPPSSDQFLVGSGPTEIYFESHPTPAAEWFEWNFYKNGNLLFTRRDQDQRYLFDEFANYEVKLSVTGGDCRCDTTFAVTIEESFLNVPNVFTPNGDGMNDEFRVDYKSIVDFHIWVYNRWNKLVYESTNPAEGWDGNIGGRPAASGAYFYVIRAKGANAAENAKYMSKIAFDKKKKSANPDDLNALIGIYQLSGDINLIR